MFKNRLKCHLAGLCVLSAGVFSLNAQTDEITATNAPGATIEAVIAATHAPGVAAGAPAAMPDATSAATNAPAGVTAAAGPATNAPAATNASPAVTAAASTVTNAPAAAPPAVAASAPATAVEAPDTAAEMKGLRLSEPPDHWPLSISIQAGTTGAGGNVSWRFADHFGLRGGMDYFRYSHSGEIEDVEYDSDVRLMGGTASLDLYPSKKSSFRISLGAFFNQNELTGSPGPNQDITIDGVTYTPAEYGTLNLRIKQKPVNPFISIGGNFFYFDRAHHWALGGELGVAYSPWDVSLTHSGGTNPPGLDQAIQDQEDQIDDKLKNYPIWPILKLQVTCSF